MKYIPVIILLIAVSFFVTVNRAQATAELPVLCFDGDVVVACPTDTPTPTDEVTPDPTDTPVVTDTPTVTVTPTSVPSTGAQAGDNRDDGRGCKSHDCSVHVVVPQGAPATGRAGE